MPLWEGIKIFMRQQKEQQSKQKLNSNMRENAVEAVKQYFAPKNMFHCPFFERR